MKMLNMRIRIVALAIMTIFLLAACDFINGGYVEYNPRTAEFLNFLDEAHPLAFGTSAKEDTNTVTINPDGSINLYAKNDTNSAGKIAGSEDGITFFFREVSASRNFKITADVKILSFGGVGTEGDTTSN